MAVSFSPLWNTLHKKEINKSTFKKESNISNSTYKRLVNNQSVTTDTLDKICTYLECDMEDIVMYVEEDTNRMFYDPKFKLNSSLNTISLFSGAGGLDIGLTKSGFNVVYANDIDSDAAENYAYNIGDIQKLDVTKVNAKDLPDADVVIGGFPCQPFSSAGNRLGAEDLRGNLFNDILRIVEEKKPKVVIMENVRGLLSMKNKDGSKLIDTIQYLLENIDPTYTVNYKLLRASDYGVPQERYRVFIVAIRKDLGFTYSFPAKLTSNKDHLVVGKTIDSIEGLPNQDEVWNLSPQAQSLVKWIPEGGSWKDVPYEHLPDRLKKIRNNMKKYRSPNFYRRYARHEINGTITAAATPENCGILHPTKDRRYSVREIARIQSFPDDYVFVGNSIPAKYKLIGNAVPPRLAEYIGDSIVKQLSEHGY